MYPEDYTPINEPNDLSQGGGVNDDFDPNAWQPLRVPTGVLESAGESIIDKVDTLAGTNPDSAVLHVQLSGGVKKYANGKCF